MKNIIVFHHYLQNFEIFILRLLFGRPKYECIMIIIKKNNCDYYSATAKIIVLFSITILIQYLYKIDTILVQDAHDATQCIHFFFHQFMWILGPLPILYHFIWEIVLQQERGTSKQPNMFVDQI